MTWKLNACPRCRGDLFVDRDNDGWFEQCLQCGFRKELKPIAEGKRGPPEAERLPWSGVETPEKRKAKASAANKKEES